MFSGIASKLTCLTFAASGREHDIRHTLVARINAGNRKFPFVNVQFSKNHRPIPINGATYYLRLSNSGIGPCSAI